jgi:acyl-CoA thioesterase I
VRPAILAALGAVAAAGVAAVLLSDGRACSRAPPRPVPPRAQGPRNRWGGPLLPAPLVSRGVRVASRPSGASVVVDGVYRSGRSWGGGHPTPSNPSWVALRLDGGYSRVLLSWTSSGNHDWRDQFYGAPRDYRIETSADSTDGAGGTWRTVVEVKDNPVRARAHSFGFEGQRWARLVVTRLPEKVNEWGLWIDEIDVHDLSEGGDDVWVFLGDSITSGVFDRAAPHQPSFAEAIAARHPGYFPAMIGAGTGSLHAADAVRDVDLVLALNPDARVFAIGVGSNDWDPAPFRAGLERLVRRIREAGRIPVAARIPFRSDSRTDFAGRLSLEVDAVTAALGLLPGPDLYAHFEAHPERLADGLHPDDQGSVEMSRLWAEAAAPLYDP